MKNKAQATLEFTVVFVIMVALLLGMVKLWKISSDKIINRQIEYNNARLTEAKKDPTLPVDLKIIEVGSGGGSGSVIDDGKGGGYGGGGGGSW